MLGLLWLIPAIPFASALALGVLRFSRKQVAWIAVGATAASTVVSVLVTMAFLSLSAPPPSLTHIHKFCGLGSMWAASVRKLRSISIHSR
jgi:NADH:ubiquinone oxidoreductase subunit 5 (subunit L)/multisubunit Na+/H+ antiporter MnhA subunit